MFVKMDWKVVDLCILGFTTNTKTNKYIWVFMILVRTRKLLKWIFMHWTSKLEKNVSSHIACIWIWLLLFFYVVGCLWCTPGGLFLRSAGPHNSAQTWGEATSLLLHSKTGQNHMFRWNWRSTCFLSKQIWWVSVSYSTLLMLLHPSGLFIDSHIIKQMLRWHKHRRRQFKLQLSVIKQTLIEIYLRPLYYFQFFFLIFTLFQIQ